MIIDFYNDRKTLFINLFNCEITPIKPEEDLSSVNNIVLQINADMFDFIKNSHNRLLLNNFLNSLAKRTNATYVYISKCPEEYSSNDISFYYNKLKKFQNIVNAYFTSSVSYIIDMSNGEYPEILHNDFDFSNILRHNLIVKDKQILMVKKRISKIANLIKSKTDSPYEQHLLALHFISQYVYKLEKNIEKPALSRQLYTIFQSGAKYICCAGYARLYTEIMRKLGIDAQTTRAPNHLLARVYINDKKYNINGVYAVDPTNLSRTAQETNHPFTINHFANLAISTILSDEPFKHPKSFLIESELREAKEYQQFMKNIAECKFESRHQFYLLLLSLERKYPINNTFAFMIDKLDNIAKKNGIKAVIEKYGEKIYSPLSVGTFSKDIQKIASYDNTLAQNIKKDMKLQRENYMAQPITTEQVLKFCQPYAPLSSVEELEQELAYYTTAYNTRKETLQEVCTSILNEMKKSKKETLTYEEGYRILKNVLKKKDLPSFVKNNIFSFINGGILKVHIPLSLSKNSLLNATKNGFFILDNEQYQEVQENLYQNSRSIVSRNSKSFTGFDYLENPSRNFTHLPDYQYFKIERNTKDIDFHTMKRAVEACKSLVKEEDYLLFKQDLSETSNEEEQEYSILKVASKNERVK